MQKNNICRLLLLAAVCAGGIALRANDIEPSKEFYTAVRAPRPIVLDGKLDEWSGAPVLADPKFSVKAGFEGTAQGKGSGAAGEYILFERYNGGDWTGPDDHTSAVMVVYDNDNVYFGFIVTDEYHENAANSAWNGDSVQLMIANEFRDEQIALYNYAIGGVEGAIGDLVTANRHEAGPAADPGCACETQVAITRDSVAKKTYYEIRLPAASLGLAAPLAQGTKFGLGMAINDGDQATPGQKGWGGLGAHSIVFGKTPSETAEVTLGAQATGTDKIFFSAVATGGRSLSFRVNDKGTAILDPASVKLTVDNQVVTPTASAKSGDATDFSYTYPTALAAGTQHTYKIEAKDTAGVTVTDEGTFTVPAGFFPGENLPGPTPSGNMWAVRHVWGTGEQFSALGAAIAAVKAVGTPDFLGVFHDSTSPEINYGAGAAGLFGGDLPYPDPVVNDASGLWTGDDFAQLGIHQLQITEEGDYTFGVKSDDGFGLRIRGGTAVSVSGNGILDLNDPEAVVHPGTTGNSNTRAVYHLKPGTYRIEFLWYERGGGDNGEIYWAKGAFQNDAQTRDWRLVGSNKAAPPVLPPEELPGPKVVDNAWAIRYVFGTGEQIGNIPTVLATLKAVGTPEFAGAFVDTTSPIINYGNGGFFANGLPYPDAVINHASGLWTGDDFIQLSVGNIEIPEEGDYTFGVHSDDGFALRIRGGEVVSVSGNGTPDLGDPSAVLHPANTGDSSTRAVYHLKQGIYRVEFFWWERGGGDHGELYSAKGAFANDGSTDQWTLVGDPSPSVEFVSLGLDQSGVTVISSDPGGEQLTTWEAAEADLAATGGSPKTYDIFDIGDPNTNGGVQPFPKNTSADDNDFAIRATATLVVPQNGTYVIGFNSDDGAYLKIAGQRFLEILPGANGASVIQDPPDTLFCDCLTGDANTFAKITLAAGSYPIEAGMFERGGGAYLRIKGSLDGAPRLPVLAKNGAGTFRTPVALSLTDRPPAVEESLRVSVARSGNTLTIQWTPTGGTLETTSSLSGTPTWTAVGTANPATVTIGAGPAFYRVRK